MPANIFLYFQVFGGVRKLGENVYLQAVMTVMVTFKPFPNSKVEMPMKI